MAYLKGPRIEPWQVLEKEKRLDSSPFASFLLKWNFHASF
jgi:hypothetical protein